MHAHLIELRYATWHENRSVLKQIAWVVYGVCAMWPLQFRWQADYPASP